MQVKETLDWLRSTPHRVPALLAFELPLTASQLNQRLGRSPAQAEATREVLRSLRGCGPLVTCLNPGVSRQRLYGLTALGRACREALCAEYGLPVLDEPDTPIDWPLYAACCHRYRSAVLRVMEAGVPLQPAGLKRRILRQLPSVNVSANNLRDVVKWMARRDLLRPVEARGKTHTHFGLTEQGIRFQNLLRRAYTPIRIQQTPGYSTASCS